MGGAGALWRWLRGSCGGEEWGGEGGRRRSAEKIFFFAWGQGLVQHTFIAQLIFPTSIEARSSGRSSNNAQALPSSFSFAQKNSSSSSSSSSSPQAYHPPQPHLSLQTTTTMPPPSPSSSPHNPSNYIPTPFVTESIGGGYRTHDIFSRLLMERIVCLNGPVDADVSLHRRPAPLPRGRRARKAHLAYINSPGGSVTADSPSTTP